MIAAPETECQASSSIAATLSEDNIEDVQIFIELIQADNTAALHTIDLAFFREYLISLGATVPAPKSTEPEYQSDGGGGGERESQAQRLRIFLPRATKLDGPEGLRSWRRRSRLRSRGSSSFSFSRISQRCRQARLRRSGRAGVGRAAPPLMPDVLAPVKEVLAEAAPGFAAMPVTVLSGFLGAERRLC